MHFKCVLISCFVHFCQQHTNVKSDTIFHPPLVLRTECHRLHLLYCHHTCSYMKRGEKPEGYRQMRPKTFPTSNYSGNSQHMLQEIRNSLRNLPKPSDPPKDFSGPVKMPSEDSRQQGRCSNPKNHHHHKALQEIRKSLLPFANEPASGPEVKKLEPPCAGFEEVRWLFSCFSHSDRLLWRIVEEFHSKHNSVRASNHFEGFVYERSI